MELGGGEGKKYPKYEEIRSILPNELFEKNEFVFIKNWCIDVLMVYALFCASTHIPLNVSYAPLWVSYGFLQGTLATGLWVLGHECGHGTFSESTWKNDLLGYFTHTFLLVPYFTWKRSHSVHHSNTGHMTKDEGHVPPRSGENTNKLEKTTVYYRSKIEKTFFYPIYRTVVLLFVGWVGYLTFGVTGGSHYYPSNHFIVPNKLVPERYFLSSSFSTVSLLAMLWTLLEYAKRTTYTHLFLQYFLPYVIVNVWLALYTFLHHTDPDVPRYDDEEWDFVKGALCTIDRTAYGSLIDSIHHHIGSTHVVHHLFSGIPHYNAPKATQLLKAFLQTRYPGVYIEDQTSIPTALFRSARTSYMKYNSEQKAWYFHKA
jgi:fatty acid desaturase